MPAESELVISPGTAKHVAALLEREVRGDERAAPLSGLDDDRCPTEAGDDSVAGGKPPRRGLHARLVLGHDETVLADAPREIRMGRGVVAVDPAAENRDR